MPAKSPSVADAAVQQLIALGAQLRAHRKALGVNATTAAEAAGMSRVTLHRIERGEPSVTMGAYANAMAALGLDIGVQARNDAAGKGDDGRQGWIPARVRIADYPQLKRLAWQVHGTGELAPREALDIYERNRRHLDLPALQPAERDLVEALRLAFGSGSDV